MKRRLRSASAAGAAVGVGVAAAGGAGAAVAAAAPAGYAAVGCQLLGNGANQYFFNGTDHEIFAVQALNAYSSVHLSKVVTPLPDGRLYQYRCRALFGTTPPPSPLPTHLSELT